MSSQTVVDVVISGTTATVVDAQVDGITTVAGTPQVTNVSGQIPDLGVTTNYLAGQGEILSLTNDIANLRANVIITGQTLTDEIGVLSGVLISTGNYLESNILTLSGNLIASGNSLDSLRDILSGNLITTGQTLQTQITSNDSDIASLVTNLITTGQTLQTQITSNDGDIATLTSNLVATGQTLTTDINTVSTNLISTGKVVDDISGNLITTGQTLQTQITSNDGDITTLTSDVSTLTSNVVTTGQTLQTQITSNDSDIATLDSTTVKLTTNQSIAGNKIFSDRVTINNLHVTGTEVIVDVENLAVKDNLIHINSGESGAGISRISGGITIDRGTEPDANILYNDANERFELNFPLALQGNLAVTANQTGVYASAASLVTTGQTLQTQITSNDGDISTLTTNLVTTGAALTSEVGIVSGLITDNDGDITALKTATGVLKTSTDANTSNLIATGSFLDSEIAIVSGLAGGSVVDELSGNLITTGQTLTTDINAVDSKVGVGSSNLIATGQNLQIQITSNDGDISTLTSNLITTGQTLTSEIIIVSGLTTGSASDPALSGKVDTLSGNLITTGQTLQTQITSNDGDISTLTTNLISTGSIVDDISGNLITTGQTLQTQITSNDTDISTLTSNVITTGQTLTSEIAIVSGIAEAHTDVSALSGKVDDISGNLITTGQTLQTQITSNDTDISNLTANLISTGTIVDDISGNLITTGQTLQTQITSNDSEIAQLQYDVEYVDSTLTTNLNTTGQTLTTNINTVSTNLISTGSIVDDISGNLIATGQTLQTQITSNDGDITTLTSNLITTGQTLTSEIAIVSGIATGGSAEDFAALSGDLITTGQTLQTQITSNDSDISDLTSNLVTTGQTLTTDINTVSTNLISTGAIVDDISGNLITTGQTLQTQITSNDGDITTLTSNLITTGQTLTSEIGTVSGLITDNDAEIAALLSATGELKTDTNRNASNLITTGQTLTTNINTVSTNLVSTGSIVDDISGNLITTGQTLQTQITSNDGDITNLTSNLITTGQTLTTEITTVSGLITDNDGDITALKAATGVLKTSTDNNTANLISTGAIVDDISGNLITTGQTLQTQITSNDSDISTLTSNLISTGSVVDDISGNLITTGQTLQTQITSNDSDISTLTSNLVTTGQTLTTNINTVSSNLVSTGSVVDDISGNLITTGQTLQTQITSNDGDISTLTTNLGTTGQTLQTQITSNDADIAALDSTTVKLTTNQSVAGNKIFTDTVTINNLTVTGTEVIVDVENLAVRDNIIHINSGESGAGISRISGGITIDRGTEPAANILYNDANDRFELNFPLATEGNLVASAANLITTGQTLQTQITSNDGDITTLTTNLGTTGQTLQTQITSNDSDISTLTSNLSTTNSNLVTTGQTLTTNINTVSTNLVSTGSIVDDISGNLITTGQTLQTQITSNDTDITNLSSNLVATGQTLTTNIDTVATNLVTTGQTLTSEIITVSGLIPATVIDGGGTANKVPLWSDANTIGDSVISQSSSKIGIGTATPRRTLHVHQEAASSTYLQVTNSSTSSTNDGQGFQFGVGGDGTANIVQRENLALTFLTNNIERIRILAGGSVGIGTTAPAAKLHVNGTTILGDVPNNDWGANHAIGLSSSNGLLMSEAGVANNSNRLFLFYNASGSPKLEMYQGNTTKKVVIDSNGVSYFLGGNFGIGTDSPQYALEVAVDGGEFDLTDSGDSYNRRVRLGDSSGNGGYITVYNDSEVGNVVLRSYGDSSFTGGDVGIGIASPDVRFHVETSVADVLSKFINTDGTSGHGLLVKAGGSASGKYIATFRDAANNTRMHLLADGKVGIGTTDPQKTFDVNGTSYFRNNTFHVDGAKAVFGAGDDLQIFHDGSNSYVSDQGTGQLILLTNSFRVNNAANSENIITAEENGAVNLFYNDSKKLETNSGGITVTGTAILGGASFVDNATAYFGTGNDLRIFHDGTDSFIKDAGQGNLKLLTDEFRLRNAADSAHMLTSSQGGAVTIYHNGAQKLITTSTGVTVTGAFKTTTILDTNDSAGTSGQILTSTGSALDWKTLGEISGVDGSGTANYLSKWTDTDTIGNSSIFDNDSQVTIDVPVGIVAGSGSGTLTGRLQIGSTTSSANNSLVFWRGAKPTLAANQGAILYESSGMSDGEGMTFMSDKGYKFLDDAGTTEWVRIISDGRVGIGTTAPDAHKLTVVGGDDAEGTVHFHQNVATNNPTLYIQQVGEGGNAGSTTGLLIKCDGQNGGLSHLIRAIGTNSNVNSGTDVDAFVVRNDGKVGIGTAAPPTKLYVAGGDIAIDNNQQYKIKNSGGTAIQVLTLSTSNTLTVGGTSLGGRISFQEGYSTPTMVVSGQKVGIGTEAPLAKLHVREASAGSFTYDGTADTLIVESNANGGITIATAAANTGRIIFASPNDPTGAEIKYSDAASLMTIGTTTPNDHLVLQAGNGVEAVRVQSDGNVGIGTTAPISLFDVFFTSSRRLLSNYDDSLITLKASNNSSNPENLRLVADDIIFNTGTSGSGSERMRITDAGKVGIGVIPATDWDSAHEAIQLGLTASLFSGGAATGWTQLMKNGRYVGGGVYKYITTDEASRYNQKNDGTHHFDVAPSGTANAAITFTTALSIINSGNVGIGTNAPEYPLHISDADSAIYLVGSDQGRIILQDTGATSNSQAFDIVSKEDKLHFRRLNNGRDSVHATVMALSGDKVGIGTTAPTQKLEVRGNAHLEGAGANLTINATSSYPYINMEEADTLRYQQAYDTVNDRAYFIAVQSGSQMWFGTANVERMRIDSSGKVGIGTDAPGEKLQISGTEAVIKLVDTAATSAGYVDFDGTALQLNTNRNPNTGAFADTSKSHAYISLTGANGGSKILFYTANANNTTGTQRAIIEADGTLDLKSAKFKINGSAGSSGQTLTTDGSGNISWSSAGSGTISGSGTDNYVPRFNGTSAIENSTITDDGTTVTVGAEHLVLTDGLITSTADSNGRISNWKANSAGWAVNVFKTNGGADKWAHGINNSNEYYLYNYATSSTDFIVKADGKVGIGTTSPGKSLDVNGDIRIRGDAGKLNFYRSTNPEDIAYIQYNNGASRLDIAANNKDIVFMNENGPAESMRISNSGKVGIGTNAPANTLHVNGQTRLGSWAKIMHTGDSTQAGYIGSGADLAFGDSNDLCLRGTDSIKFTTNDGQSDAMTIDVNGKVGIGTNTPYEVLHINKANDGGDVCLRIQNADSGNSTDETITIEFVQTGSGADGGRIIAGREGLYTHPWSNADSFLAFYTALNNADTERMRITSAGKVGIGTTAPGAKLHVYGGNIRISSTDDKPQLEFFETAAARWVIGHSNAPNNYFAISEGSDVAASERLVIAPTTGSVGIGTATPGASLHIDTSENGTGGLWIKNAGNGYAANLVQEAGTAGRLNLYVAGTRYVAISANSDSYFNGGNVGIGSASPAAPLDVPRASDYKVIKLGDDITSHYVMSGNSDHTLTLTCASYFQAEIVITAHQTNGGTYNNLYMRGIWSNNHTSHHWDEIENVGDISGSTFTITIGQNGSTTNSGEWKIVHDYTSGTFVKFTVRVTDFYNTHSYTIS